MNWFETYTKLAELAEAVRDEIETGSGCDGLVGPCEAIRSLVSDPRADWVLPRPDDIHEGAHVLKRAYAAYAREHERRDMRRHLGDRHPGEGMSIPLDKYDAANTAFDELIGWEEPK